jgi:hypothetical protein
MKKWLHRIAMGTFALFVLLYGFVCLRSVGKNLKDDGGDDRESKTDFAQRHLDLVFPFDF